jgi:hypothetical protein
MANQCKAECVLKKLAEIKQAGKDLTPLEERHLKPLSGKKQFAFREASQVESVHRRVCPGSSLGSCFAAPPKKEKTDGVQSTKK